MKLCGRSRNLPSWLFIGTVFWLFCRREISLPVPKTYKIRVSPEEYRRLQTASLHQLSLQDIRLIEALGIDRTPTTQMPPDREYWIVGRFDPEGSRICRLCGYDEPKSVSEDIQIPESDVNCFFFHVLFQAGNPVEIRSVETLDSRL